MPQPGIPQSLGRCQAMRIRNMIASIVRLSGERGQGLPEYALIIALVGVVAIVALLYLGGAISGVMSTVGNSL